jgi:Holliday junction resolvasome RuvABC ATP-dependent DNA helicase subunit
MSRAEITTPEIIPDESVVELSLRPQRLSEFIGQDRVKESLRIYIDAALGLCRSVLRACINGVRCGVHSKRAKCSRRRAECS